MTALKRMYVGGQPADGDSVSDAVHSAAAQDASLRTSGRRPDGYARRHFCAPTVLSGVKPESSIFAEDIFGPAASLIDSFDEQYVQRKANDTESDLKACRFTRDPAKEGRSAAGLRFGEVQMNGIKNGIDRSHAGIKQFGVCCNRSHLALHDYLVPRRMPRSLAA